MTLIHDPVSMGVLPAQHPTYADDGATLWERSVQRYCRIFGRAAGDNAAGQWEYDAEGDGIGWCYVDRESPSLRDHGAWAHAWPMLVVDDGPAGTTARPVLSASSAGWTPDPRFKATEVWPHPGAKLPTGTPVLVVDTVDESGQTLVAYPAGGGPIIDQWRGKDAPTYSTLFADLDGEGAVDKAKLARVDTLCRVTPWGIAPTGSVDPTAPPPPNTIALVLTAAVGGGGHCWAYGLTPGTLVGLDDSPATPATPAVAVCSVEGGGPLSIGYGAADRHMMGTSPEGLALNPLHLTTVTPFHPPGAGGERADGPLEFEAGEWPMVSELAIKTKVHLRWRPDGTDPGSPAPGSWDWYASSALQAPTGEGGAGGAGGGEWAPRSIQGAASPNELEAPAVAFRAQPSWLPGRDLRYAAAVTAEDLAAWGALPVVGVLTAGLRVGDGRPVRNLTAGAGGDTYASGTGRGFVALHPPEMPLANYRQGAQYPDTLAPAGTALALFDARLFLAASWDPSTGDPTEGWEIERQADAALRVRYLDASGAADQSVALQIANVTVFSAATRYPIRAVFGAGGSTTITTADHTLLVDPGGGTHTVTLPAAAGVAGVIYQIKQIAAGTVAITSADNIDGSGAYNLAAANASVVIKSSGATYWAF